MRLRAAPATRDLPGCEVMACNCDGAMCKGPPFRCGDCGKATPWCCGADDERAALCDECAVQTELKTAPRGAAKTNEG